MRLSNVDFTEIALLLENKFITGADVYGIV